MYDSTTVGGRGPSRRRTTPTGCAVPRGATPACRAHRCASPSCPGRRPGVGRGRRGAGHRMEPARRRAAHGRYITIYRTSPIPPISTSASIPMTDPGIDLRLPRSARRQLRPRRTGADDDAPGWLSTWSGLSSGARSARSVSDVRRPHARRAPVGRHGDPHPSGPEYLRWAARPTRPTSRSKALALPPRSPPRGHRHRHRLDAHPGADVSHGAS